MKRTNMFKALATILAVAMIIAMVPMAAMAANTTSADVTYADGKATVKGSINADAELTMIVVRTEEEITSLDYFTSDADLENAIMYIDQITATANTEKTWSFELRNTADGNVLTAFVGGTDASVAMDSYVIPKAAPAIAYSGEATIFDDQDIVFDVTGGSEDWANAATVYVNGEVYDNSSVAADSITLTDVTANVTAIKVVVAGYEDAAWAGTITVKNRMAVAKEAIENAEVAYDTDEGSEIAEGYATITLPEAVADANETGVAISYSLKKGEDEVEVTDRVATVARPAEGAEADVYTVIATLTYGELTDTEEKTVSVKAIGASGPSITADNVKVLSDASKGAYGDKNKQLVKVVTDEVDNSTKKFVVDSAEFYYSVAHEAYYGIVSTTYADAAAIADALTAGVVDGETTSFYFGVVVPTNKNEKPGMADAGAIARLATKLETSAADLVWIAGDVAQGKLDGQIGMADAGALARVATKLDADLAINSAK